MTLYQFFALFIYLVTEKNWVLSMEAHIPGVDHKSHPGFEITYAYGTWASYIGATAYVCSDCVLVTFSILIISRFDITMYKISKIGVKKSGDSLAEFDRQQRKLLDEIVRFSQTTYEFLSNYSDWYFYILLSYYFTGTMILGLCFLHVTLDHFGNSLAVIPAFSFRIYLVSYIGQKVTDKNDELYDSLYFSQWYNLTDNNLRRTIAIMLIRFQKPVGYTLGGISVVGLLTYGNVMKNVYSFVAFIANMMD